MVEVQMMELDTRRRSERLWPWAFLAVAVMLIIRWLYAGDPVIPREADEGRAEPRATAAHVGQVGQVVFSPSPA
jgi:hypothetical protein